MPLLPLNHLCSCFTCVCAGCSVAVCPFCLLCQIVLFPLLLEGKPFWGELAHFPVNLNHLYWHVLKLKYNQTYWFTQNLTWTWKNSFAIAFTRFRLCMVTSPIKERDKADTLDTIELIALDKISGCGPLSGQSPTFKSQISRVHISG